jgi:hypothetical protein
MVVQMTLLQEWKDPTNQSNPRTRELRGSCIRLPKAGEPFVMFSQPEDDEVDSGVFFTSEVKSQTLAVNVDSPAEQFMVFHTKNSSYHLHLLSTLPEGMALNEEA